MLPDSRYLLSGNQDGSLKLWDTTTGRQEKVYRGHHKPVTAMAVFETAGRPFRAVQTAASPFGIYTVEKNEAATGYPMPRYQPVHVTE